MKNPVLYLEDGSEKTLPVKWCICGQCQGNGTSSAYLGAYTWDEMEQQGEQFIEDYFDGAFDRLCDPCGGTGKVMEVDLSRLSDDEKKAWRAQEREMRQCERENQMERMMGA